MKRIAPIKISAKPVKVLVAVVGREVCKWTGDNFPQAIYEIGKIDTELKVRVKNGRLVLSDPERAFYMSVAIGEMIEIPINNIIIDDEIVHPAEPTPPHVDSEETIRMMRDWGLVAQETQSPD